MEEKDNSKFFNLQRIRNLNFWILGLWSVLRLLDFIFSYIYVIVLKTAFELNPIGINLTMFIVAFTPILGIFIFNYKIHEMKAAIFLILFILILLTTIQVVVTINALTGGIIGA